MRICLDVLTCIGPHLSGGFIMPSSDTTRNTWRTTFQRLSRARQATTVTSFVQFLAIFRRNISKTVPKAVQASGQSSRFSAIIVAHHAVIQVRFAPLAAMILTGRRETKSQLRRLTRMLQFGVKTTLDRAAQNLDLVAIVSSILQSIDYRQRKAYTLRVRSARLVGLAIQD